MAGSTKTPTPTTEPHEATSAGPLAPGETTSGPGTRALLALLSGGDGTATAVAELLERHPDERADLLGELQAQTGNSFVVQVLSAQAAPVAGVVPAGAGAGAPSAHERQLDELRRLAPRLQAAAGGGAPAVVADAGSLDISAALAWLGEVVELFRAASFAADGSLSIVALAAPEAVGQEMRQLERAIKAAFEPARAGAVASVRALGERVREAAIAVVNDSSVLQTVEGVRLPERGEVSAWRNAAIALAELSATHSNLADLRPGALLCQDAALALLQGHAVAEARRAMRAGTLRSLPTAQAGRAAGSPGRPRDELDDVFADSGFDRQQSVVDGRLADWCGMFVAAQLFRGAGLDKDLRLAFAHTNNVRDFFTYTVTARYERAPLSIWADGRWQSVREYHEARGSVRQWTRGADGDIRPGDVVLIDHDGREGGFVPGSIADHIVMVESYDRATGKLVTIEGNIFDELRPAGDGAMARDAGGNLRHSPQAPGGTTSGVHVRDLHDDRAANVTPVGKDAAGNYQTRGRRSIFGVGRPSLVDFEDHQFIGQEVPAQYRFIPPAEIRAQAGMSVVSHDNEAPADGPYQRRAAAGG